MQVFQNQCSNLHLLGKSRKINTFAYPKLPAFWIYYFKTLPYESFSLKLCQTVTHQAKEFFMPVWSQLNFQSPWQQLFPDLSCINHPALSESLLSLSGLCFQGQIWLVNTDSFHSYSLFSPKGVRLLDNLFNVLIDLSNLDFLFCTQT